MEPRCDPVSDTAIYFENQQACHDTTVRLIENQQACHDAAVKILEHLGQVIEMRHKIGEARLTSEGKKTIPALEKGLSEAARPILDTYSREEENCKKTDEAQSCIYAEQFRSFIKFFGPVVPEAAGPEHSPVLIEMAHLKSGWIVVPLEPKSSGYEVLLDTGANSTALSVKTANLFKDSIRILTQKTEYGQKALPVVIKEMEFNLGGIKFEPTGGLVSPFVDYFEGSNERHNLVAILGADFLFHRSWGVNYDKSNLVLEQDVEKEISEDNRWSQVPVFPTKPYSPSYFMGVDAYINGKPFRLELDTGSNVTTLIEQCPLPEAKASREGFSLSVEGLHEDKKFKNVHIKLGKNELIEDVSVDPENLVNASGLHKVGLCGYIGTDVLGRYNYMYDPETLSLYIRPRDDKNIPRLRGTGFILERAKQEGGQLAFVVTGITPDTPAEKAGLKIGDMIIEFDGRKSESTSMLELLETDYSSKPEIPVTIIRDGKVEKLTLLFKK